MAYKARDDACGHSSWEGGQAKLSFGKVGWLGWHKFRWHLLTSANINAETSACLLNHWFEHLTNEHVEENKVIRTSFGWIYKAGPILSPVRRTCLLGPFFSKWFWGPPCKGMQSLKPSARNYVVQWFHPFLGDQFLGMHASFIRQNYHQKEFIEGLMKGQWWLVTP